MSIIKNGTTLDINMFARFTQKPISAVANWQTEIGDGIEKKNRIELIKTKKIIIEIIVND